MYIADFFKLLEAKETADRIPYVQKQCSSLSLEFSQISQDVEELEWAKTAFGSPDGPDATNIWIGDSRATSSLHKDPYENIYCCISGQKTFTLIPPCDTPFLYRKLYPVAQYDNQMEIIESVEDQKVPWIELDPDNADMEKFPLFKNATVLKAVLNPGDVLYLPSLWYHKVAQADDTIAVNFWYDMQFNANYGMSTFYDALDGI